MINHENGNYKQLCDFSLNIDNKRLRKSTGVIVLLVAILTIPIFAIPPSTSKAYAQSPYSSGYDHGCDDAKIANPDDRYINQPGKGPTYHTGSFMNGYYDGFDSCFDSNTPPTTTNKGTFKIVVEVTNHSFRDIYGGITVSVDHYPDNLFKSAYGIYFPAGETSSKTFSFEAGSVPVGTGFEVNIDYGDDYNQRQFGENNPSKKAEVIHFNIP
jgi:hypothetical protein